MKKYLIIVDPQNDFLTNGSLPVQDSVDVLDKLVRHLTESFHLYENIFLTIDWHPWNHCSFIPNGGTQPCHCIAGTYGAEVYSCLQKIIKSELYIEKVKYFYKGVEENRDVHSVFDLNKRGDIQNASGRIMYEQINSKPDDTRIAICGVSGDECMLETIKDIAQLFGKDDIDVLYDYVACSDKEKFKNYVNKIGINLVSEE